LDFHLAGVDTHPHAHVDALGPTPGGKRSLRAHRSGDRIARPHKGDEEAVTFGMDLATVVVVERRAQHALMLGKHLGVAAAQPRQQPRRTLDVAEQERDGATRKLRDNAQLRPIPAACQECPPTALSQPSLADRIRAPGHSMTGAPARLLGFDEGSTLGASLHPDIH
jgi:hypothetical protein